MPAKWLPATDLLARCNASFATAAVAASKTGASRDTDERRVDRRGDNETERADHFAQLEGEDGAGFGDAQRRHCSHRPRGASPPQRAHAGATVGQKDPRSRATVRPSMSWRTRCARCSGTAERPIRSILSVAKPFDPLRAGGRDRGALVMAGGRAASVTGGERRRSAAVPIPFLNRVRPSRTSTTRWQSSTTAGVRGTVDAGAGSGERGS